MNHTQLNIKHQCELLGLNRFSYYASPTAITADDQKILNRMDEIFTEHPYYGNRRMMHVLRAEGIMIGRSVLGVITKFWALKRFTPRWT